MSTAGNEGAAGPNANDAQSHHSSHSRAPTHRSHHKPSSEAEARVPFFLWWVVGGKGRPPTMSNLLRMAHERNEVTRKAKARAEARKKAQAERTKYLQDWDKQWGDGGLMALVFGSKPPEKRLRIKEKPRTERVS
ncbi:hypothetical protein F5B19DRAFT_490586 [Rostrohypoxylon terebratum]|nr:hypothetical protein F5B19DRAFT_490586 [Rostrohypoxylon terebratum]